MHCELWKFSYRHFTSVAMHTVSQKVSWHRTQILPFTQWPPLWILCSVCFCFFPLTCAPFCWKRFVKGKRLERTVQKCSDGSYSVRIDPVSSLLSQRLVDGDAIGHSLLSFLNFFFYFFFFLNSSGQIAISLRRGKTRLWCKKRVHECWESVYNILPSAALNYVDTCFKMWCISLYLSVLNTLCFSSS